MFQPLSVVGLTHASSVIPFVRSSELESGTEMKLEVVPLKDAAEPKTPFGLQVTLLSVPVFPWPERSPAVVPVPSSKL